MGDEPTDPPKVAANVGEQLGDRRAHEVTDVSRCCLEVMLSVAEAPFRLLEGLQVGVSPHRLRGQGLGLLTAVAALVAHDKGAPITRGARLPGGGEAPPRLPPEPALPGHSPASAKTGSACYLTIASLGFPAGTIAGSWSTVPRRSAAG